MMISPQSIGLGNCPPPSANSVPNYAGAAAGVAVSVGAGIGVATGVLSAASGGLLAPVAPIIGLIVSNLFTPDYCKIDESDAANQTADQMKANLQSWQALPANQKCASVQAYYENNFNELWQGLVNYCGQSQFGQTGQNCINERNRGGEYDMWAPFYDPIANDTSVLPDLQCPALIAQGISNATGGLITGSDLETLAIPAGLILLALFL